MRSMRDDRFDHQREIGTVQAVHEKGRGQGACNRHHPVWRDGHDHIHGRLWSFPGSSSKAGQYVIMVLVDLHNGPQ